MTSGAVVLVSGGLDSATALAVARERGFALHAMTFRYGQRHACELEAARRVAGGLGVAQHLFVDIDLTAWGGSALTGDGDVPKDRDPEAEDIPVTYVPARNTIFLSFAVAWAETLDVRDVFLGVNALDYSGYPDCRPAFLDAFQEVARLGTRAGVEGRGVRLHAPLLRMTKEEIIREGVRLGVDYAWTHSCYDPDGEGRACGRCDSCRLRLKGFRAAGVPDPAAYAPGRSGARG